MRGRSLVAAASVLAAIIASSFTGTAFATPVFSLRVEAPGKTVDQLSADEKTAYDMA